MSTLTQLRVKARRLLDQLEQQKEEIHVQPISDAELKNRLQHYFAINPYLTFDDLDRILIHEKR